MIVYRHIRKDNNKVFYVGLGSFKQRATSKTGRTRHWRSIVAKAGYTVEIVAENLSRKEAVDLECLLIKEYGDQLCNVTKGGDVGCLGYKHSEEAKKRIGKASIGRNTQPRTKKQIEAARRLGKRSISTNPMVALQYTKEGEFIKEWDSAQQAGIELGINAGNICSCRNGNRKTAGGFVWKHKELSRV